MSSFSSGGGGGGGSVSSNSKYEGYGSGAGSGGNSGGSNLARKYEAYSGDSKYYDSNAKELNNNNNEKLDRYDKYDYNSKFRSDNDVKDKKEETPAAWPQPQNFAGFDKNFTNFSKTDFKAESPKEPDQSLKNFKLPKPGEKPEPKKEVPKSQEPVFQMSLLDLDDKPVPQTPIQPQPQPQTTNINWNMPFVAPPVQVQVNNSQITNQNWNWANAPISPPVNSQGSAPISPQINQINAPKPPANQFNQGSNINNNQFNLTGITFDSNINQNKNLNLNQNQNANLTQVPKAPASTNLIDQFDDFQGGNPQSLQSPQKDNNAYKSFNAVESSLINLSDLGKLEKKSAATPASPDTNLLLTTQYDLDSFNLSPQQKTKPVGVNNHMMNMNPNMMNMNPNMNMHPNMNLNMNMNPNMGMMGMNMNPNMMNPNLNYMNMGMMGNMGYPMGMQGQHMYMGQMGNMGYGMGQMKK